MKITPDEVLRIREKLSVGAPIAHCAPFCEHIECSYIVELEKYSAEMAALALSTIQPLLDAVESGWAREIRTCTALDTFIGELEAANKKLDEAWDAIGPARQARWLGVQLDEVIKIHKAELEEYRVERNEFLSEIEKLTKCTDDLTERRDKLLTLVAKVTRETPYPGELDECRWAERFSWQRSGL